MAQGPYHYGGQACRKCMPSVEQRAAARPHSRRPTVHRGVDRKQMAIQRSRARLINQLTYPNGDQYTIIPTCPVTNHTYAIAAHTSHICSKAKQNPTVSTYPVQYLRWNPYVETSNIDDFKADNYEDSPLKCMCENCATKECLAKVSSSALKPGYRDNIMKFCDRHTMTARLTDAACGCADALPPTRESQISVTASEFTTRDPIANLHTEACYTRKHPPPILKKSKAAPISPQFYDNREFNFESFYSDDYDLQETFKYEKAERDTLDNKLDRFNAMEMCTYKFNGKQRSGENDRKMIYNEGISDTIADHNPVISRVVPPSSNLRKNCSRVSINALRARRGLDDESSCQPPAIPYSHRNDSMYHQCCKNPENKVYFFDDDSERRAATAAGLVRTSKTTRCKTPPKLPKRMLTSHRDIDAYIESNCPKIPMPLSVKRKISASLLRS